MPPLHVRALTAVWAFFAFFRYLVASLVSPAAAGDYRAARERRRLGSGGGGGGGGGSGGGGGGPRVSGLAALRARAAAAPGRGGCANGACGLR
jgi:hypothetical protein